MNARPILFLCAVVAAGGVTSAWHFQRSAQSTTNMLQTARVEVRQLQSNLARLRQTARSSATGAKAAATVAGKRVSASSPIDMADRALRAQMQQTTNVRKAALLASPELQVLYGESRRAEYRAQFAALFRRLNLPDDKQDALLSSLVAWDMKTHDLQAVMKERGFSRDDPALKAQRAEADQVLVREVEAALGPGATTITREYSKLDMARSYIAGYGGLFARLGQPLTFRQVEELTETFSAVAPQVAPDPVRLNTRQWDELRVRAQRILTPGQWLIFQSTTSPGQNAGRWESAASEALARLALDGKK